jgi:hypothetical protein
VNENNLEKMLLKLKKISKEKADQLQKRTYRKLSIKEKKRPVTKNKDSNSELAKIGE